MVKPVKYSLRDRFVWMQGKSDALYASIPIFDVFMTLEQMFMEALDRGLLEKVQPVRFIFNNWPEL